MVTQERLRELLEYDPDTGIFTWRVDRGSAKIGSVAGRVSRSHGYSEIGVDGRLYRAHRLAWLYVYGEFPSKQLDHINRVRSDNRIANLRPATCAENFQNKNKYRNNTSGVIGVHWNKNYGKWQAEIKAEGQKIYLGSYNTIEEAAAARTAAKAKLHTFHSEDSNEKAS